MVHISDYQAGLTNVTNKIKLYNLKGRETPALPNLLPFQISTIDPDERTKLEK
jgi:hypothetical protein